MADEPGPVRGDVQGQEARPATLEAVTAEDRQAAVQCMGSRKPWSAFRLWLGSRPGHRRRVAVAAGASSEVGEAAARAAAHEDLSGKVND